MVQNTRNYNDGVAAQNTVSQVMTVKPRVKLTPSMLPVPNAAIVFSTTPNMYSCALAWWMLLFSLSNFSLYVPASPLKNVWT